MVSDLADAVEVSVGGGHACARRRNGRIACWGGNSTAQLGRGSFEPSPVPVAVWHLLDAVQIDAGFRHTCALRTNAEVACWGNNVEGQLGTTPDDAVLERFGVIHLDEI